MATPRTPRKRAGPQNDPAAPLADDGTVQEARVPPEDPAPDDRTDSAPLPSQDMTDGEDGSAAMAELVVPPDDADGPTMGPDMPPADERTAQADPVETVPPYATPQPDRDDEAPRPPTPQNGGPQEPPARGKGGFLALVLGGAIAAALGFFAGRAMLPDDGTASLRSQVAQQTQDISGLKSSVQSLPVPPDLSDDVASVRDMATKAMDTAEAAKAAAAAPPEGLDALTARVGEVETQLTALKDASANAVDAATVTTLQSTVASIRTDLAAQQEAVSKKADEARAAEASAQAAQDAANKAQAAAQKAQAETAAATAKAEADAKAASRASAVAQIDTALAAGQPYVGPVAVLKEAGVSVPDSLSQSAAAGIATQADLVKSFDAPARQALQDARRVRASGGFGERFGAFVKSQTSARSLSPQEGTSPDAVLSRAEAALKRGDLAAALDEIGALPPEAQSTMAEWVGRVQARIGATEGMTALSASNGKG